ncbi:MAG TPA: general secretion pathway protein GspB [Gammaproteobacteria bacterium]
MSFILDALRKSEHERQRSTVPGLAHVPLATVPPPLPRWAVAAIAALGVAVLVLAGAWWQSTRSDADTAATRPEPALQRTVVLPPPAASPPTTLPAPVSAGAERAPNERTLATAAANEPAVPPFASASRAETPSVAAPSVAAPSRQVADESALPTAAALAAQGVALPQLRLELHAFSERPSERYVFINGRKYVEGERLPEGTQLLSITPVGAVLSQYGQRFLLLPE